MEKNIFIPALEARQRGELQTTRDADGRSFHGLLDVASLVEAGTFSFDDLLERCRKELKKFPGEVNAIVAQWDFPTSVIVPILCHEYGIPSPSLESVLKCEHKYWSRLEQEKVIPDCLPRFCSIDPFADDPLSQVELDYPFWLKPVKAFSSQLGFRIENAEQFRRAIDTMREKIHHFGDPFNEALAHTHLPAEIRQANGNTCIAEEIVSGTESAPEGSIFRGEFHVHGMFDLPIDNPDDLYDRMEYPSSLPDDVQQRMIDASQRFLEHIGYDNGCFNVEFMWDRGTDRLRLIEVNTRISQSHSEAFIMVDGMSNHEIAIDVALGQRPSIPYRQGRFAVAAKCIIFHHGDGIVTRVPSQTELDALAERFPGAWVRLDVAPGMRLRDLPNQDRFSYHLGTIYLGGETHRQVRERYEACLKALHFEFDDVPS